MNDRPKIVRQQIDDPGLNINDLTMSLPSQAVLARPRNTKIREIACVVGRQRVHSPRPLSITRSHDHQSSRLDCFQFCR